MSGMLNPGDGGTLSPSAISSFGRNFGAWHALWLILGILFIQLLSGFLVGFGFGLVEAIKAVLSDHPIQHHLQVPKIQLLGWVLIINGLLAAVWSVLYTRWMTGGRFGAGDATDIAWRMPDKKTWLLVALGGGVILAIAGLGIEVIWPPDAAHLTGPVEMLSRSQGWPFMLFVVYAIAIAPPLEEFVFRGVAFAALTRSFGTVAATVVTTLVFMLMHVADKIHYLPGFVAVGLMALAAVALRLRYRSLGPAILLHTTYNSILIVTGLLH